MFLSAVLVIITLSLVGATNAQQLIAETSDGKTRFYLYKESVSREKETILFTGKTVTKLLSSLDLILANCERRTYMVLTSYQERGKRVDYIYHRNPKKLFATRGSAMDIALDYVCTTP